MPVAALQSARVHRSGWQDLFIKRELDYIPRGGDRYFMLIVKALAGFLGTMSISVGAVAPLIVKSEHFSTVDYGHIVGVVGIVAAFIAMFAAHLADRFTRIRILLWGMLPPLAIHFVIAFMPDGRPVEFVLLYAMMAWTEAMAVVVVSALLRDFSPRANRSVAVGLVTVGTLSANWAATFSAGRLLERVGTWQHMFFVFGLISIGCWLVLWVFGREPSSGYRAQIVPSLEHLDQVQSRARELESQGVHVESFWGFIRSDWRLWLLALGQGLFLFGYITFVAFGPLFTVQGFHQSPQTAAAITSWIYASIIVFLILGGIASDWLRMRKLLGVVFTTLSGIGLIGLGLSVGHHLGQGQIILLYVVIGAVMATMWSPTNALFSENAEDIAATRQTTAFGGQGVVTRVVDQAWIFFAPSLLAGHGWGAIWVVTGVAALAAAPIIAWCRGPWGRFSVDDLETRAAAAWQQAIEGEPGPGAPMAGVAAPGDVPAGD